MSQRSRIIILSVLSILIVVCIVLGVTYSFMQANIDSDSVTEVSLSSCAKITLEDGGDSIVLENSYPVSRNVGLNTDPYTFTITSDCDSYVGFNMYLATLSTNTLSDNSIHYVITEHYSKDVLVEGILNEAEDALSEFNGDEKNQINVGLNGTFGTIYKLYYDNIPLKGSATYNLYLWIDESVTNDTMNQVFRAGVAVKSYERDMTDLEKCYGNNFSECLIDVLYTGVDGDNNIYYHDGLGTYTNASLEAGDNSYRFAGGNHALSDLAISSGYTYNTLITFINNSKNTKLTSIPSSASYYYTLAYNTEYQFYTFQEAVLQAFHDGYLTENLVNNYVCFGSDITPCPSENLYRIIGLFDENQDGVYNVKLIKATYAKADVLGTNGGYISMDGDMPLYSNHSNSNSNNSIGNNWKELGINLINLNTNFWNSIDDKWQEKILLNNWTVNSKWFYEHILKNGAKEAYDYELGINKDSEYYQEELGLMYVSDYYYGANPDFWTYGGNNYYPYYFGSEKGNTYALSIIFNWLFVGAEFTMMTYNYGAYIIESDGDVFVSGEQDSELPLETSLQVKKLNNSLIPSPIRYLWSTSAVMRPVFYLKDNILLIGGTGTQTDPYRIA